MTTDDFTHPGDENSNSWDSVRREMPNSSLPVIAILQKADGWITMDTLVIETGLTVEQTEDYINLLEDTGEVETYDLGRMTLITLPSIDHRHAISQLSDRLERKWREEIGDETVERD